MTARHDRDFVNVATEISYWRNRFGTGTLIGDDFHKDYEPIVRLTCEIYVRAPHASRMQWMHELDHRLLVMLYPKDSVITGQIANLCWDHLSFGEEPG